MRGGEEGRGKVMESKGTEGKGNRQNIEENGRERERDERKGKRREEK